MDPNPASQALNSSQNPMRDAAKRNGKHSSGLKLKDWQQDKLLEMHLLLLILEGFMEEGVGVVLVIRTGGRMSDSILAVRPADTWAVQQYEKEHLEEVEEAGVVLLVGMRAEQEQEQEQEEEVVVVALAALIQIRRIHASRTNPV